MQRFAVLAFVVTVGVLGASCSTQDSSDTTSTVTTAPPTTTTAATTTTKTDAGEATATSLPEQAAIEQLLSDYRDAVGFTADTFSREDFLAVVDDAFKVTNHLYYAFGEELRNTGTHVDPVEEIYLESAWQLDHASEPVVAGTGPWVVSVVECYTKGLDYFEGTATYVIMETDGALKVADRYWIGRYGPIDE